MSFKFILKKQQICCRRNFHMHLLSFRMHCRMKQLPRKFIYSYFVLFHKFLVQFSRFNRIYQNKHFMRFKWTEFEFAIRVHIRFSYVRLFEQVKIDSGTISNSWNGKFYFYKQFVHMAWKFKRAFIDIFRRPDIVSHCKLATQIDVSLNKKIKTN